MKNKVPRESVKSMKVHSQKPVATKRQTAARNPVRQGPNGKAKTCRVKALVARRQPSAKPLTTAESKHAEIGKTLRANTPKHGSTQLQELERGRQWKQLHEQGLSLAVIAENLPARKLLLGISWTWPAFPRIWKKLICKERWAGKWSWNWHGRGTRRTGRRPIRKSLPGWSRLIRDRILRLL